MLFLTTTAITMDEELLNRCLVLTVDEGREQTCAIHGRQRTSQTLEGLLARTEREHVVRLHHRAQRLLRPLAVVKPLAETLLYGDERTRSRRDHAKYLSLIQAVTLLYQHQREEKTAVTRDGEVVTYLETTRGDIEAATRISRWWCGRRRRSCRRRRGVCTSSSWIWSAARRRGRASRRAR